ncbi:MAG: hypothetical protein WC549_04705 [Actinomycetota bacterium]
MDKLLQFLDGRKTYILAISGLIIGYLSTANIIDGKLATLILSILNVIAGGAVVATDQVLGRRNISGVRSK